MIALVLGFVCLLIVAAMGGAAFYTYQQLGRTPGELLDYVQRRLEGHTKLEWVALPAMAVVRSALNAPSAQMRAMLPFEVPPPPPRLGPSEISRPGPIPTGAKVWRVSGSGPYFRIADVAKLARAGDVVEIEAGDYYGDVTTWLQARLTIRGVNGVARLFAAGRSAEHKAIWVIRRGEFDISNVDFVGAKVADKNGAGIRFEGGHLRLRNCLFWGNEMGLLTSPDEGPPVSTVTIESSEFAYSRVENKWGHNLYVGKMHALTVRGSYFHHAGVGHLLKSRASINTIEYNRFTDESGGRASYELNFPNGGDVRVIGNVIQQQRESENSTLIAYGEEGYFWPSNRLLITSNTLVNDHPHGGRFLRVANGADRVVLANNLMVGPGALLAGEGGVDFNNVRVAWESFVNAFRYDYRLKVLKPELSYQPVWDTELSRQLLPSSQYVHPRSVLPLRSPPLYVGAHPK